MCNFILFAAFDWLESLKREESRKRRMEKLSSAKEDHSSLVNIVFSWTIQDALNEALFKYKVVFFLLIPVICLEETFVIEHTRHGFN